MHNKFIFNTLIVIIPILLLIVGINFYVDSGSIFKNWGSEIAKIIVSGKNAGIKQIPSKFADLQIEVLKKNIDKGNAAKDIMVFGTSRSSEISSDIFPNNTFFNCAIPGGTIVDYVGLYGLYKSNFRLPKYLILSIDSWTFHSIDPKNIDREIFFIYDSLTPIQPRIELLESFRKGLSNLNIDTAKFQSNVNIENSFSSTYSKYIEMLNLSYFQINLKSLNGKYLITTDQDYVEGYFVIRKDGGYSLKNQTEVDSNFVINHSKKFSEILKSKFFIDADTNNIYFDLFKKFVRKIKSEGVTPIIYISPINPIVFDNLSKSMQVEIENEIIKFCKENEILIVGSFNPHKYGYNYTSNNFIDEIHPVKNVVKNIFSIHSNDLKSIGINTTK